MMYFPAQWQGLALQLAALLTRNETLIAAGLTAETGSLVPFISQDLSLTEAQNGIKCSDQKKYARQEDWDVIRLARHEKSFLADASDVVVTCARWPFNAKERYTGNFSVDTPNPILLIGNTADPITPIASARNVSAGYPGSVVLEHGSPGHGSSSTLGSSCTAMAIRKYFVNGILPEPDTVCEVDVPIFGGDNGWVAITQGLGPVSVAQAVVDGLEG
jgi:hypothetical protein